MLIVKTTSSLNAECHNGPNCNCLHINSLPGLALSSKPGSLEERSTKFCISFRNEIKTNWNNTFKHPTISSKSINQSLNQSIIKSKNQPLNQPINQSINQSIIESINHRINESTTESINQSINQSMDQWIHQSIKQYLLSRQSRMRGVLGQSG